MGCTFMNKPIKILTSLFLVVSIFSVGFGVGRLNRRSSADNIPSKSTKFIATKVSKNNLINKEPVKVNQITDLKVLEDRAKKGITDDKDSHFLIGSSKDDKGTTAQYKTSQKINTLTDKDGKITNSYAATVFIPCKTVTDNTNSPSLSIANGKNIITPKANNNSTNSLNLSRLNTSSNDNWDTTYDVLVAIQVYYDRISYSNYDMYRVNNVYGEIERKGSTYVKDLNMISKAWGRSYTDGNPNSPAGITHYDYEGSIDDPTVGKWYSQKVGTPNLYYDCGVSGTYVGAQSRADLYYRGSSWNVYVNFIGGSGINFSF